MNQRRFFARTCYFGCFTLGIINFLMGMLLMQYFNDIFDYTLGVFLDLTPGSTAFNEWRTNDPPLIMDLHFFNWTNADQIYNRSVKPRFERIGPYRYYEVKEKVNITYFPHNQTMSWKYIKKYYFLGDESPRQLDDVLTLINLVPLSAAYKVRFKSSFYKMPISFALSSMSNLYETKTAREWIFDGFDEPILSTLSSVMDVQDKFGWFYGRNYTGPPDVYTMSTKFDGSFGRILEMNYKNRTTYFKDSCGELHGSAGEFHPPNTNRSHITVFSSEMCTYQNLYYEDDVDIKGILAYKFAAKYVFDNGRLFPENKCFCEGECLPHGVLNISVCRNDAPVFLSLPHFYGADRSYTEAIEGMEPTKEEHEFYITLEPKSSIVVDCGGRMQLNVLLQPIRGIRMYENVPKVMIPVFYFDQVFTVNDTLAQNMRIMQSLPEISKIASVVIIVIGTLLMGSAVICIVCSRQKDERKKPKTHKCVLETAETVPLK